MGIADDFIKAFLKEHPEADNGKLSFGELNALLKQFREKGNDTPKEDFDGLSSNQMHLLLYFPLSKPSLLPINESCPYAIINQSPLFVLSEFLLQTIIAKGKIKLTAKGNLPVAICEMLYGSQDLYFTSKLLSQFVLLIT